MIQHILYVQMKCEHVSQSSSFPAFPIGLNANWHEEYPSLLVDGKHGMHDWLFDPASLTEKLEAKCQCFSVHVLGQAVIKINQEEQRALNQNDAMACVREVVLMGDGVPWVFARSLIPEAFFRMGDTGLDNIGDKPLGKLIFNDARFSRGDFDIAQVTHPLLKNHQQVWARRSGFEYQGLKLLVGEVFLPESPAYGELHV
jgi:chorismate--pyruvate lyase